MSYSVKTLHWTTVEVRGDDGMFHLGRVTDCVSEGLMVDFGCGTVPQLVPFGQIYHGDLDSHKCRHAVAQGQRRPVHALIRLSSLVPAKWYPGVLLMGDFGGFGSFGLVRATVPKYGPLVEIVPADHIREWFSDKFNSLLENGRFVKVELHLPSGVSSGSPSPSPYKSAPADQRLVDRFNKNCSGERILATHIDGGVLHVLKSTDRVDRGNPYYNGPLLEGANLLSMLGVTSAPLSAASITSQKRCSDGEDQTSASKKIPTKTVPLPGTSSQEASMPHCQCLASTSTLDRSFDFRAGVIETPLKDSVPINDILPEELLGEIFSFLEGTVQTKLVRVCSRWNSVLNTASVSRMLRLPEEKDSLISGICLLKRWTAQTKIISNTSLDNLRKRLEDKKAYDSMMCSGRLFRLIMQEHHLSRLEKLILANISWEWSPASLADDHFGNFVDHLREELTLFASVCQSLVLKDVTVSLSGFKNRAWVTYTSGLKLIVHITRGVIEGELSVECLWNWMENSLPGLTDADAKYWKEAIDDSGDPELPDQLAEILNDCQSADPRSDNQFRGKEWSREDLVDLDLEKLNRITLHSLLNTCSYQKLVMVLAW